MLFYDDQTETFWSQMTGEALVGPQTGKRLKWIETTVASWKSWRAAHPKTTVLKPVLPQKAYTQIHRNYTRYRNGGSPVFPVGPKPVDSDFPKMEPVTILLAPDGPRGYPHSKLKEGANRDGHYRVILEKDGTVRVTDAKGSTLPSETAYYFAWRVFYPGGTTVTKFQ